MMRNDARLGPGGTRRRLDLLPFARPQLDATVFAGRTAAGLNALGLAFAALTMRPGCPSVPLDERLAYLATTPVGWSLGWGVWMLAAVALVVFVLLFARELPAGPLAPLAVVFCAMGASVDLLCDVVQLGVLPQLAAGAPRDPTLFLALERALWSGGVVVACGLYSLAVALLTLGLWRCGSTDGLALVAGVSTAAFGVVWIGADLAGIQALLEPATAGSVGSFIVWAIRAPLALRREAVRAGAAPQS